MDKLQVMIKLSDEILEDLENNKMSLEDVITKCKKLARIKEDNEAYNWFFLEVNGYGEKELPANIQKEDLICYARLSGRTFLGKDRISLQDSEQFYISSISEIESQIENDTIRLKALKIPDTYTPPIQKSSQGEGILPSSSWEGPVETLSQVIADIEHRKEALANRIRSYRGVLAKIKNNIYQYVLNINVQLKFETVLENIFQKAKTKVDDELRKTNPDIIKNLLAAFDRIGNKPEEWTQALNSCRLALKAFADIVFPAREDNYKMKDGNELKVTDDKVKNRIYAFIDAKLKSTSRKVLLSRAGDLCERVNIINDFLAKGTHKELELKDVEMCLINTYLLLADLVDLIK